MSLKNKLILSAVKALRFKSFKTATPQRILVVSTTALGDTLWATPSLANLRSAYPKAYIAVLTSKIGKQVLSHHPAIDALLLLKEPMVLHFLSLWRTLCRGRFDTVLILHASQRLVLPLCALSGAERIIGTKGQHKGLDSLLTEAVLPRFQHEIERRFAIVSCLGVASEVESLSYFVQENEREAASQKLRSFGKKLRIALHPGSKEPFRRWPLRFFAKVGEELQKRFDCEIFLTGTSIEKEIVEEVQRYLPSAHLYAVNSSLREFGAFLEQMDLVVSNDTGPFHLATALNKAVVGIYVSTDPRVCGPFKALNAVVISRAPTCNPCLKRRCLEPFCFLQIAPEEVIKACTMILSKNEGSSRSFFAEIS